MHRPRDVLDRVLAPIRDPDRQLLADLLAHRGADADLAGLGQRLKPGGDVDAVTEDVAVVDDDVAEIDADAKADALAFGDVGVTVLHPLLHDDGATHGVDDRGELDQHPVTGRLDDAPLVLGDQRGDQLSAMALEGRERPFLVGAHEARIRGYIGAEERCYPPLNTLFLHHSPTKRPTPPAPS